MSESVTTGRFIYSRGAHAGFHSILQIFLAHMMPLFEAGARIDRALCCGKNILPGPLARSIWLFPLQRARQMNCAEAFCKVDIVPAFYLIQMNSNAGTRRDPATSFFDLFRL